MSDYLEANKKNWDSRVEAHIESDFYDNESFLAGRNSLNAIELKLLGDVKSKSVIHLQCHFGQDSLSLARMGAQVVGVDISEKALEKAREFNQQLGLDAEFIASDILIFDQKHERQYDIVFSSYGVIGWHPDIEQWARVVSHLLKPGGRLVFVEFHPVIWMFDSQFKMIQHSYFNKEAIVEENLDSYTDGSDFKEPMKEYGWNHSLGEVINALQNSGLSIDAFDEYDYSPYACFDGCIKSGSGYQIKGLEGKLPLLYSLVAIKS